MNDPVQFDFLDLALKDLANDGLRSLTTYLPRFPGHETLIAGEYQSLLRAQQGKSEEPNCEKVIIGNYRILGDLGHGGQGSIYLALEIDLERATALKVLNQPKSLLTPLQWQRFRREAEAVSRLDHPYICRLFEAQLEKHPPFLAMEFVPGLALDEILKKARDPQPNEESLLPIPPKNRAELLPLLLLFERLAGALAAAHDAGIIHRDVKPGNIMVRPDGDPVLLDFGLASIADANVRLTRTGDIFGTLSYMAPEQMEAEGEVDARADIYALAATLYECLTLSLPHKEDSWTALRHAVQTHRPQDPRQLNQALPDDLCRVLESALEKHPDGRCQSASFFQAELCRIRRYQPILTAPPSRLRMLYMWAKREPKMVSGIASLCGLMLIWLLVLGHYSGIASANLMRAESTEKDLLVKRRNLAAADLAREVSDGLHFQKLWHSTMALVIAKKLAIGPDQGFLDSVAIDFMSDISEDLDVRSTNDWPISMAVSENGSTYAWHYGTVAKTSTQVHFQRPNATEIQTLQIQGGVYELTLDGKGDKLGVVTMEGDIFLVDLQSNQIAHLASGFNTKHKSISFSPGAQFLIALHRDAPARLAIWNATSKEVVIDREIHDGNCCPDFAFSKDGQYLATFSGSYYNWPNPSDNKVRIWDLATGICMQVSEPMQNPPTTCHFSPVDSASLWLGTLDGEVIEWDWKLQKKNQIADLGRRVFDLDLTNDGGLLAVGLEALSSGQPPTAIILDPISGSSTPLPKGQTRSMINVEFSPNGKRLATAGWDGTLRVWQVADLRLIRENSFNSFNPGPGVRWLPDGERVFVPGPKLGYSYILFSDRGTFSYNLEAHRNSVIWCGIGLSGKLAITASLDGDAVIWDPSNPRDWKEISRLQHDSGITGASFLNNENDFITGCQDGTVNIWNLKTRTIIKQFQHSQGVLNLSLSPSEKYLAVSLKGGGLHLWNLPSGKGRLMTDTHKGEITSATFNDLDHLLTTGVDSHAVIWDCTVNQVHYRSPFLKGNFTENVGLGCGVFLGPEGRRIAVTGKVDQIFILDSMGEDLPIKAQTIILSTLSYLPEQKTLRGTHENSGAISYFEYSQSAGTLVKSLWNTGTLSLMKWSGPTAGSNSRRVSCHADGSVFIWPSEVGLRPISLQGHSSQPGSAAMHPDGSHLIAGYQDGVVRIWSLSVEKDLHELAQRMPWMNRLSQRPEIQKLMEELPEVLASLENSFYGY